MTKWTMVIMVTCDYIGMKPPHVIAICSRTWSLSITRHEQTVQTKLIKGLTELEASTVFFIQSSILPQEGEEYHLIRRYV